MTEAAADIIATYAQTPKHLTGPPVVNWAALVDGDLTDAQLMGVLAAHPARPLDIVRAHNARARKARARDIKALADKYQVSEQSIRAELPRPRVSSVTGGPVPTWPEAWEMVRDTTGEGPHTPATMPISAEQTTAWFTISGRSTRLRRLNPQPRRTTHDPHRPRLLPHPAGRRRSPPRGPLRVV